MSSHIHAAPRRVGRAVFATVAASAVVLGGATLVPASADALGVTAAFTGGTGTVSAGGTLYAKSGGQLTLTVTSDADTQCVTGVPADFAGARTSSSGKRTWTFTGTGPSGNGTQAFTLAASAKYNAQGDCSGQSASASASYVSDNAGPVVSSTLSPAANTAGWVNKNATLAWSASDGPLGSGVVSGPTPASSNETSDGKFVRTSSATDRLGNVGTGSANVWMDQAAPAISATQTRNADGSVTVRFVCDDAGGSGTVSCLVDGTTSDTVTVTSDRRVSGTATDLAGNTASTTVAVKAGDITPPTLSGAPTTQPNPAGWYRGDVKIHWTAGDPETGITSSPADTVISGEGTGLTSSATVTNGAGLSTTASSTPAVSIDRTPPVTTISGGSNNWVGGDVTLSLTPTDNLSHVDRTTYTVDGGAEQTGTRFALTADGQHTVTYRSTDVAGNVEALQTAVVKIDKTAPTIRHEFTPSSYTDGAWTNQDVTVSFVCADQGGSGVADCTAPVTTSSEGEHTVAGTAKDAAGNSATDSASVRIDKTKPTLTADVAGAKNDAGWYRDDVTVTYTASDALSGITGSPEADVLGEGPNQGASASVTDRAGNPANVSVSGINVDKTAPVLTADVPTGWHTDDVTVTWTCTDGLSGVAGKPTSAPVGGEGANLSATASCTDVAGNGTTKTVDGIKIDRTAPVTTATVADADEAGWYDDDVTVTLHGSDNLSDVTTYYSLDGGDAKTYTGAFAVGEGEHTVSYWSKDAAGNVEKAGAPLELKVDKTAPATTVVNPISPASGWFVTSGIPVAFAATDGGAGIQATYYQVDGGQVRTYGEPFTADLSTGTHTITYWSVDLAGNVEAHATTNTIPVNVDTDAPTIKGTATPAANPFGWNNTDVDVTFECHDVGSGLQTGVAGCAGDTPLTNDGAGQSVTGDTIDIAGNKSSTTVAGINIDKVKPTLVGVPTAAPNGAGWYHGDVTVTWKGDDALSGIDPSTQPEATVVTGEGDGLSAGPATVADKAGNTSAPATLGGIKIDRTAPVVQGAPTTSPNAAGWYSSSVKVDFTCTDNLSGVASCPTSQTLSTDGADQSVTGDRAVDVAGNPSAATTVGGIDIDGTAPSTTANNTCTVENGWCKGDSADVVLAATDQAGLSGVKEIRYTVDGGTEQVFQGARTTVTVPLSGSGAGNVRYYAVDNAGNREAASAVALKWDNIAPTVTHTLSPAANADGWNTSDVTVSFAGKDDDKGSGVASTTAPVTVSDETAGRVVDGSARDNAGNVGTDAVTVKLDRTKPTIVGTITSGQQGANGWYTGPVTVTFTCADDLSGVATCPTPVVLSANGANSTTGTATDRAGNTATVAVDGIRIDQEKPALTTAGVNVAGATYTLGAVPAAACTATDSVSGIASCAVKVTGGNSNGTGAFSWTATATDKAGNTATTSGTYQVVYRFDGFLQPINDTAHQVGTSTSIFKAGSTVPVKLQLMKADGTVVQAATAPGWLTPTKGSTTTAPLDESVYSASADSGSAYRYDTTAQQYVYNWKSGSAGGNYWRIGVRLDDGQTYYVNIGLR